MFGEGIIFKITHFQMRMKGMTSFTACFNEKELFAVMQKENNVRFSENSLQSCSLSAAERQHFPSSGRLVSSSICLLGDSGTKDFWRQLGIVCLHLGGNYIVLFLIALMNDVTLKTKDFLFQSLETAGNHLVILWRPFDYGLFCFLLRKTMND